MTRLVRWLIPAGCFLFGLELLRRAFRAYADWQELLAVGDPSGAELPATDFWLLISGALPLIVLAAFLAGRWSRR